MRQGFLFPGRSVGPNERAAGNRLWAHPCFGGEGWCRATADAGGEKNERHGPRHRLREKGFDSGKKGSP
jgi:hypothetical protein